jgi:hypothetical protein
VGETVGSEFWRVLDFWFVSYYDGPLYGEVKETE